ncbi:MAG: AraC family transcriptional regulator, partial [Flavobacteriaceae bacterium]
FSCHSIKDEFRWMILFSFVLYLVLSARLVFKSKRKKGLTPKKIKVDKYAFSRNTVALFIFLLIFLFLVFLNHDDDGGDHYIAILQTIITFITTFFIISESRFFENSWIADKYETLTANGLHFSELENFIHNNNYFESPKATLKDLAKKLGTNPNLVSKVINTHTGSNFNDYINQKRVQLAKEKLVRAEYAHLTVEAIGELVGFSSKSAFYNAFKKYAGTSPSQYSKNKVSPEL